MDEIINHPGHNNSGRIHLIPKVSDDEMVSGLTFEIENIRMNQTGNYTCIISNSYGTLKKTVNIFTGKLLGHELCLY